MRSDRNGITARARNDACSGCNSIHVRKGHEQDPISTESHHLSVELERALDDLTRRSDADGGTVSFDDEPGEIGYHSPRNDGIGSLDRLLNPSPEGHNRN